jgi:hypothetical protein
MGRYIAQVTFQDVSGLSKDRFENDWHFNSGAGVGNIAEANGIIQKLSDFYTTQDVAGNSVAAFLSPVINNTVSVKVYDETRPATTGGTPPPRPILAQSHFGLGTASTGTQGLPEEIALCLSYYSTSNSARHRGRIYLGPLNTSGLEEDAQPRPKAIFLNAIIHAAERMIIPAVTPPVGGFAPIPDFPIPNLTVAAYAPWAVRSGIGTGTKAAPVVTYEDVEHGWVDNEWDGQSRRRIEASARVSF